jgi:hypothetical protein
MDERGGADDFEAALDRVSREHVMIFHHHFTEFMASHLTDCCSVFDGDLHEMLVFTILAQRYLRDLMASQQEYGDAPADDRRAVSATRIAAQTGMPRETVRRKLAALQARGWIEKIGRADWRIAFTGEEVAARLELDDFVKREIRRVVRFARALKPIV